ncbi:hypothetical protein PFISCL1PPCAC_10585, partial [Pristionchus fissidentatus]
QKEEEEKKKKEKERERKKAMEASQPVANPLPDGERKRIKPKVAFHRGRDPGIVDTPSGVPPPRNSRTVGPQLLDRIMEDIGKKNTDIVILPNRQPLPREPPGGPPRVYPPMGNKQGMPKRPSNGIEGRKTTGGLSLLSSGSSRAPVEKVIELDEMEIVLPLGASIDLPSASQAGPSSPSPKNSPYINPTMHSMYAPSIGMDDSGGGEGEGRERVIYGRASLVSTPEPMRDNDEEEGEMSSHRQSEKRRERTTSMRRRESREKGDESKEKEKEEGRISPDSTSLDGPASPIRDAPSSPIDNETMGDEATSTTSSRGTAEDVYGVNIASGSDLAPPELLYRTRRENRPRRPDPRLFPEVLSNLRQFIEDEEGSLIVQALQWKLNSERRNHFDDQNNRKFLCEMVAESDGPSEMTETILRSIIQWDEENADYEERMRAFTRDQLINKDVPLSLALCPIETTVDGYWKRYTALSEAVIKRKFGWARFLVQNGANVNEIVNYTQYDFNDKIILVAVENELAATGINVNPYFPMVRLLLSVGANRQKSLRYLEGRRRGILAETKMSQATFNKDFSHYIHLHELLKAACDSVAQAFKIALKSIPSVSECFTIGWIREIVCSLPFDLLLPLTDFDKYINGRELNEYRGLEAVHVFAVVVGISSDEIVRTTQSSQTNINVQVDSIDMVHPRGQSPFVVSPEGKIPKGGVKHVMDSLTLMPVDEYHSIFFVPPNLLDEIKHLVVRMRRDRVHTERPVYAALVRLDFKEEIMEDARLRRTNEMCRSY